MEREDVHVLQWELISFDICALSCNVTSVVCMYLFIAECITVIPFSDGLVELGNI